MIYYSLRLKSNGKYLRGTPTYAEYSTVAGARVFTTVGDLKKFVNAFTKVKINEKRKGWSQCPNITMSDLEVVEYVVTETETKGVHEFVKPELIIQMLGD